METFKCPKCGQVCEKCSELVVDQFTLDVFQCENDACLVPWKVGESTFPTAYTVAVDADGNAFEPPEPFDPTMN
jgi:hypothetical protein